MQLEWSFNKVSPWAYYCVPNLHSYVVKKMVCNFSLCRYYGLY
jgi:hypothetical protein